MRLQDVVAMPFVDLGLQVVSAGQQFLVLRGEIGDHLVHTRPEGVGVQSGARQGLVGDEVVEHLRDAQIADDDAVSHVSSYARLGLAVNQS